MPASMPSFVSKISQQSNRLRGNPWLTLVSVAFGLVMVGLDATVVAVANPVISKDLHTSLSQLQWITNAYMLVLAVMLIFGGKLGDRYGRRLMFLVGVTGFALSSLGVGLIGSTDGVIVFRALQGVFGALLMPSTLAILRATFDAEKLNLAIGIWGGASAISVAAGPIVGGLLVEHVSWQSVFYINLPVGAIALAIGMLVLRESHAEEPEPHDLPGILLLAGGLFLIVFGLIKAETWGWGDAKTIVFLVIGLCALCAFRLVELRRKAPLLPMRLFSNRSLTISTIVVTVGFLTLFGVLFFMTLYLENVHGYSAVQAGVRLLPLSLVMIVTAPIGGLVTEKLGPRPPMMLGLVLIGAGMLFMTGMHAESSYAHLWPGLAAVGIGMGLMVTSSSEAIVGNAPVDDAGIAGGLQATAMQVGGVMGTAILGSVLASRVSSVFVPKLVAAGTPGAIAHRLGSAGVDALVGQGAVPPLAGASPHLQAAVATGSHVAFMTGLHTSTVIGAVLAFIAAAIAIGVSRGAPSRVADPAAAGRSEVHPRGLELEPASPVADQD